MYYWITDNWKSGSILDKGSDDYYFMPKYIRNLVSSEATQLPFIVTTEGHRPTELATNFTKSSNDF